MTCCAKGLGWLGWVMLPALACRSPFATRDPEPPINQQSSWIQPTSSSYVMVNLRNAIAEKNAQNYLRCLADTGKAGRRFLFIPEQSVNAANPGVFRNWGYEQERIYLNQLLLYLPKDSTSQLMLTSLRESVYQDSVILLQEYELTLRHQRQATVGLVKTRGQIEFRLIRSIENMWYIHRWTDYATASQPTWSAVRAAFGN
ncbi:MAG: hypothetical protein BWY83_00348 [bacterium ADurb.Bin478]|nr:MAG: hypothetical protein BWY83_00348 [bacterium ADurb.Bin478]